MPNLAALGMSCDDLLQVFFGFLWGLLCYTHTFFFFLDTHMCVTA